jgi:ketosteroid isomerase-like protein
VSEGNVELVRRALFAEPVDLVRLFEGEDFRSAFDVSVFSPEVAVVFATPAGPPAEYEGVQGLVDGWREWLAPWASYEVHVQDIRDAGECVLALAILSGETRHGGVRIEQPAAAVVTLTDERIARIEFHLDRREAMESAGLAAKQRPPLK